MIFWEVASHPFLFLLPNFLAGFMSIIGIIYLSFNLIFIYIHSDVSSL